MVTKIVTPCQTAETISKKILNRLNLENVVFEATNFTPETGTCCIDLCITNRKKWINSVDVLTHAPVLAEISFKTFRQHSFKRKIRNYNAADIEGLVDQLNITNWDNIVFNSDNINDVYSNFLKILDDTVNNYHSSTK